VRYLSVLIVVAFAAAGCQSGRHSTSGFRLPPDGDPERGKLAFVAHKCHNCHTVSGVELPKPETESRAPVVLGGEMAAAMSDSHLFTSIAYPSYKLASIPKERAAANGRSHMPSHSDQLTIREMTDIVEFLQAHYRIREVPRAAYY